jgi:SRSO17 transposase
VETTKDRAVAAGHSVDPAGWQAVFDEAMERIAGRFGRVEPRRAARAFVSGLLSDVKSKTCWGLAEQAGYARPDAMQRLLRTARWDADAVRDDVRGFVVQRLAHPDAVLVVDETGDLKKGTRSVGVQRQYTGTAGRIENAQVGVFVAYASPRGRALVDRRLYLPTSWTDDPDRCAAAGVPADTVFATKPQLAGDMIEDALDGGVAAGWVAGDEVYGNDPGLRGRLQARGVGYVLAVSCDHRVPIDGGKVRVRADRLTDGLPASAWQAMSAGAGSKGPRFYDWAWLGLATAHGATGHSLLIRRNTTTGELAFYRCWTPTPVPLATLVRVAGARWMVEETFQAAKGQVGLDEHQVRQWTCWQRFTVLAMLALAILAACAELDAAATPADPYHHARHDDGPIALTVNEIRRLFTALLTTTVHTIAHRLRWSLWRRRHQAHARHSHYKRRLAAELHS